MLGLKLGVMVKAEVSFKAGARVIALELGLGLELGSGLNQSLSCGRPIACSYRLRMERHERHLNGRTRAFSEERPGRPARSWASC